ncbi:MAG: prolipoprotein diacylglyceryl transferase [Endomicrobiales bacterium]
MFPTLIQIGPLTIRTYGLMVAIGLFVGLRYLLSQAKARNIPENRILDIVLYSIVAGLAGARLTYVLFNWQYYARNLGEIFRIWEGGLVYYGGFAAGAVAVIVYRHFHRETSLLVLADILAPAMALGHVFGRLGCFFAGCCYGAPSQLPWAVTFRNAESLAPLGVALHPAQLYEAFGNLVIFFLLAGYNRSPHREGNTFSAYLFLYGLLRFSVEFLRADDRGGTLLGFSPGQMISAAAVAAALLLMLFRKKNENNL